MKTVDLEGHGIESWVEEAQREHVVVLRDGRPVALLIGLDGEQDALGRSDRFWRLIDERRGQAALSRVELERLLDEG